MPEGTDPAPPIALAFTREECRAAAYACELSREVFADARIGDVSVSAIGLAHSKLLHAVERSELPARRPGPSAAERTLRVGLGLLANPAFDRAPRGMAGIIARAALAAAPDDGFDRRSVQ
jgi:hypothetical protein